MGFKCPACGLDFGTDKAVWEDHIKTCNSGLAGALVSIVVDAATKKESKKSSRHRLRIDSYYDITCDSCCKSWSTDFDARTKCMERFGGGGMGMATSRSKLYKMAKKAGWVVKDDKTLCPECALLYDKENNRGG